MLHILTIISSILSVAAAIVNTLLDAINHIQSQISKAKK